MGGLGGEQHFMRNYVSLDFFARASKTDSDLQILY